MRYRYTGLGGVLLGIGWDTASVEGQQPSTGPLVVAPGDVVVSDTPLDHPTLQAIHKPPKPAVEHTEES